MLTKESKLTGILAEKALSKKKNMVWDKCKQNTINSSVSFNVTRFLTLNLGTFQLEDKKRNTC